MDKYLLIRPAGDILSVDRTSAQRLRQRFGGTNLLAWLNRIEISGTMGEYLEDSDFLVVFVDGIGEDGRATHDDDRESIQPGDHRYYRAPGAADR